MAALFSQRARMLDQLNVVALAGWICVAYLLALTSTSMDEVMTIVTMLEGICLFEVARIVVGNLPGNLLFGSILHSIRIIAMTQVIPRLDDDRVTSVILASWAVTEVSRYPMYVFPKQGTVSASARLVRMVVPVVTFPVGCGAEAYATWFVLSTNYADLNYFVILGLVYLLVVNALMGPFMAYPHILKKGVKETRLFFRSSPPVVKKGD